MADVTITELPAASSVDAKNDVAPLVSGGVTSKATPEQMVLAALAEGIEGFMFVPGGAGAPTEVPTNENSGITPLYFDEANNRLYAYNGGWKYTQFA